MVGPTTIHNRVISEYAASDDLPCADVALLVPLKRSAAFARIRKRVADHHHLDSWQEDDLHFFVFQLHPEEHGVPTIRDEAPVAVFALHREFPTPVSAVVVTPGPGARRPRFGICSARTAPTPCRSPRSAA